jgi:lipopolysaccharide/colanic/teichoic acid biosynthesis glycosyltransferase
MQEIDSRPGTIGTIGRQHKAAARGAYADFLKRGLDLALLLLISPVVLPLLALAMLLARLDGGPGLFGHVRVGRDGQTFTCWKIRTMHHDAAARLVALLCNDPAAARLWDSHGKLLRDPRITPIGRILRRLSIDELPQFWNVLRGEMSLVGPRPVTAVELERYGARGRYYLACRPGITGLWQVSGRNRLTYDDRIALDQRYAERIGLLFDLTVLARTVPAVLSLSGR